MTAKIGVEKTSGGTTRPSDNRRANKPLMEKRRRARINQSLAALKTLIVDSNKIEGHKHSKLEKADILEMTVSHLQGIRTKGKEVTGSTTPAPLSGEATIKFKEGFEECARQVSQFLDSTGVDNSLAKKLLLHLNEAWKVERERSGVDPESITHSLGSLNMLVTSPSSSSSAPYSPAGSSASSGAGSNHQPGSPCSSSYDEPSKTLLRVPLTSGSSGRSSGSSSNSPVPHPQPMDMSLGGIQVIPTRLPNGQVVFLLPGGHQPIKMEPGHSPYMAHDPDEPLDCSNKSAVNLSIRMEYGDSVWRPW